VVWRGGLPSSSRRVHGPRPRLVRHGLPLPICAEEVAILENLDMAPQVREAFFEGNAERLF
jgi:hypothetical protein